jgi:hypothetical protein
MKTRTGNATAHPGLVALTGAMKRTQAPGEKTKKDIANEKKRAKKDKHKSNVHKVAKIEKHIAADEKLANVTPKSQGTSRHKLQRTCSYAQLPLTSESASDLDNARSGDGRAGMLQEETEADTMSHKDDEANMTDSKAPPKKKTKRGFHNDVQMYLDKENKKSGSGSRNTNNQCADDVEITDSDNGDLHKDVVSKPNRFETRRQLTAII